MRFVAVHGVPLGPRSFSRLATPVDALALQGLTTVADRPSWSLRSFVDEVAPHVDRDTVLIGHDLGGVIAAMVALERPARGVILTGTALGPYWAAVRATAHPALSRFFYDRHQGRRFVAGGVGEAVRERFVAEAEPDLAAVPDLAGRMRRLATEMRPPPGLGRRLATATSVALVWGEHDRWYPAPIARAVARACRAPLTWVPGGHYAAWEAPEAFDAALAEATAGW